MNPTFDYAVFIGRFQPFHIGHLHVFTEALKNAKHLIILVGSSGTPRTFRNPFTFDERKTIIKEAIPTEMDSHISIHPLQDYTYDDDAWVNATTNIIQKVVNSPEKSIALVGHNKDETTYYLDLFPQWAYIEVSNLENINATSVRHQYFSPEKTPLGKQSFSSNILKPETIQWLRHFSHTAVYDTLVEEYQYITDYRAQWCNTPHPVIFLTTDALVRWHNEILLIKRKNSPGKGLFALPGGFLETQEKLLSGCIRELTEETQLEVEQKALENSLVKYEIFDDPKRSERGRTITTCYYFDLSHLSHKPSANAADDAQSLIWVTIASLDKATLFEDHFFIIQKLLRE